jgi:shikimate kinase
MIVQKPEKARIFLCGMPGCGKSTMGKSLAALIGHPFYDIDRLIEEKLGAAIPEIFARHGEAFFRAEEEQIVTGVCSFERGVFSLGGGALEFGASLETILASSILVWLDTPKPLLLRRLRSDNSRPLLRRADGSLRTTSELQEWIDVLYEKRAQRYRKAHIHFVPSGDVEHDAPHLVRLLKDL